ncbi:DUF1642 domain-containing protein [Lacticaseibacillus paracasei]|uniref:DUF1642 domain-containing protein n=1 Tax=Lacticaseibacillus paracasei TaxID=1597 RepID=UPI00124B95FA|nr:DUF1642 domain-containing protein [Lacticaseibacillus paracasei]KAB1966181.1 DUF1642 domain-containing protein [Lacticaseibacillus paracasei]MCT3331537.1 DUF1642 domain-containing protein [Lacticaseibacillus paracasei]
MSEEKLYAVKNDEGKYFDLKNQDGFWPLGDVHYPATSEKGFAKEMATSWGGHVVTFVEEPEKVVLTKEQAEIVEKARVSDIPATYISARTDEYNGEESLLINAYVNGYTVAKEKKYNVKVPHAEGWHFQKYSRESKRGSRNDWKPFPAKDIDSNMSKDLFLFTEAEIEHYGLQDCEKEEVTDDEV